MLRRDGKLVEALRLFEDALHLAPQLPRAHAGYAATLARLGRLKEAIAAYREAIDLQPDYYRALDHLAAAYMMAGDATSAVECYQRAARHPEFESHSDFLYTLNFHPGWTPEQVSAAHLEWGRRQLRSLAVFPQRGPARRKLRIGYVSADFRNHAVSFFFEPLLAAHDTTAFEIFCYDNSERRDDTSERLRRLGHSWRRIAELTDTQTAALIRKDRIDILIDLSGHTGRNRLQVFTRKPAPVQVTYLGYPNTTGLAAMDYRLTDALADPPGSSDALYTETLVRLPRCFLCYRPHAETPALQPSRAAQKGSFTFASFSNPAKWNDDVLDTWASILRRVPDSTLLLQHGGASNKRPEVYDALRSRVLERFQIHGIAPSRIRLIGHLKLLEHFALYHEVDLALDPFPYNGTTATCEALWMGVPVVALEGSTHASRVSASLLAAVGLNRFLAPSATAYVSIAVSAAARRQELARLRSTLRDRMARSPLMDGAGLARAVERSYRWMWRRRMRGNPPPVRRQPAILRPSALQ